MPKPTDTTIPQDLLAGSDEREAVRQFLNQMVLAEVMSESDREAILAQYDSYVSQGIPFDAGLSKVIALATDTDANVRKIFINQSVAENQQVQAKARELYNVKADAATQDFLAKQAWAEADKVNQEQKAAALGGAYGLGDQPTSWQEIVNKTITPTPDIEESQLSPFLSQLSPNLQKYWKSNISSALDPIQQVREQWWNTINQTRLEAAGKSFTHGDLVSRAGAGDTEAASALSSYGGIATQDTSPAPKDPLEAYLKNYNWYDQWLRIPAQQRGEYSSQYSPPARWG